MNDLLTKNLSKFSNVLKLLLVVITFAATNNTLAQEQIQCVELNKIVRLSSASTTSDQILDTIKSAFTSFWGEETIPRSEEVYFTNSSGFSIRPKCESITTYGPHLYYPIGLVLKKLSDKKFVGSKNEYSLVEAEHGMRMYINSDHLQKIEIDRTYFFATSLNFPEVCLGSGSCEGERKKNSAEKGIELHPTSQYAVADKIIYECAKDVNISLFRRGGELVLRRDNAVQRATINTCGIGDDWNADIKKVTAGDYQRYFANEIGGHYQRFSNSLLGRLIPDQTNLKNCNQTQTSLLSTRVGGGASLSANYLVNLNIGGSGELSGVSRTTLDEGIYIFYSSYFMQNSPTGVIETIFTCDELPTLLPEELYLVTIYNDNLDGDSVSISARELLSPQNLISGTSESPFAGIGFASVSGKQIGQYFRIKGYYEYFKLKGLFRKFLEDETQIPYLVSIDAEDHVYDRNMEFFTQLLLAAMVEPRPAR